MRAAIRALETLPNTALVRVLGQDEDERQARLEKLQPAANRPWESPRRAIVPGAKIHGR